MRSWLFPCLACVLHSQHAFVVLSMPVTCFVAFLKMATLCSPRACPLAQHLLYSSKSLFACVHRTKFHVIGYSNSLANMRLDFIGSRLILFPACSAWLHTHRFDSICTPYARNCRSLSVGYYSVGDCLHVCLILELKLRSKVGFAVGQACLPLPRHCYSWFSCHHRLILVLLRNDFSMF